MKPIGRRSVLRGLAYGTGVSVGLPVLEAMLDSHGRALADGTALPKRFGVFFWGNGVRPERFVPSATGAAYPLSPALKPLEKVRDYVSVASNYKIKTGNPRAHHAGCVGILSAAPLLEQDSTNAAFASTFSAPSIDQVVAAAIGDTTRFRSLEVGVSKRLLRGEGTTVRYLSHNGPNNANPPEYSPLAFYERVFSGFTTQPMSAPADDPKLMLRRSVLSVVREDANALRNRLGKVDQQRLDQHLESIRGLEKQLNALEMAPPPPMACKAPEAPVDMPGDEHLIATNAAMSQLLALSLACDQSRVFSMLFSGSVSGTIYSEAGMEDGHHGLTHNEPGEQPQVHEITTFIMARFAALLEALRAVPEGDGTLLDRMVILGTTDCSDPKRHAIDNYPILIAGGGDGALVHPGIHVDGEEGNTTDVLLTLLQAMDLPVKEFGEAGGRTSDTVAALRT